MDKKEFTINDIQTGDIIVTKDRGNTIMIAGRLKTTDDMFTKYGLGDLNDYDNNLETKDRSISEFDIEKVYRITNSYNCGLNDIIDKLPEDKVELIWERKKEIDWTKVPRFTKVQVKDAENEKWRNRYFVGLEPDMTYPYKATVCDKFTFVEGRNNALWKYIRLYDESDIKEEWYK